MSFIVAPLSICFCVLFSEYFDVLLAPLSYVLNVRFCDPLMLSVHHFLSIRLWADPDGEEVLEPSWKITNIYRFFSRNTSWDPF